MDRLQKVLASAGIASRRASEELIAKGIVSVNGIIIKEQGYKVSSKDNVCVNGVPITKEESVYFVLNKPIGYVSTVSDEFDRKTILDLFEHKDLTNRIYPIGRLDYNTSGLLFVTNNGDFTNKITSPESDIEKEYIARVDNLVRPEDIKKLEKGITLKTGYKTKKCYAQTISYNKKNKTSLVKIIITEGKNHQIRLMIEALGYKVIKLKRVRIGDVTIDNIPKGAYRPLKIHEIKKLKGGAKK